MVKKRGVVENHKFSINIFIILLDGKEKSPTSIADYWNDSKQRRKYVKHTQELSKKGYLSKRTRRKTHTEYEWNYYKLNLSKFLNLLIEYAKKIELPVKDNKAKAYLGDRVMSKSDLMGIIKSNDFKYDILPGFKNLPEEEKNLGALYSRIMNEYKYRKY